MLELHELRVCVSALWEGRLVQLFHLIYKLSNVVPNYWFQLHANNFFIHIFCFFNFDDWCFLMHQHGGIQCGFFNIYNVFLFWSFLIFRRFSFLNFLSTSGKNMLVSQLLAVCPLFIFAFIMKIVFVFLRKLATSVKSLYRYRINSTIFY